MSELKLRDVYSDYFSCFCCVICRSSRRTVWWGIGLDRPNMFYGSMVIVCDRISNVGRIVTRVQIVANP
jgi:hypothetical protein